MAGIDGIAAQCVITFASIVPAQPLCSPRAKDGGEGHDSLTGNGA